MSRVLLAFPPGWSLLSGGSHLALPLLKAHLEHNGNDVRCMDLNWEVGKHYAAYPPADAVRASLRNGSLDDMNEPYFAVEDRLMRIAAGVGGTWNAQLGFEYDGCPQESSVDAMAARDRASPYQPVFESFLCQLASFQPTIVGFSLAATHQIVPTIQLCHLMRAAGFDGFIVLGGNTVSRLAKEMAHSDLFDIVNGLITFQGEAPLISLCQALDREEGLERVPNLVWCDNDGVHVNGIGVAAAPEQMQCPDYADLPVGQYAGTNFLNLVAARGCYYGKCSFCAIPFGWGNGGYAGARSAELVFQDMWSLFNRHGMTRFKFVDEALSPRFMRALSHLILSAGMQFEWEGYTRLESAWVDREFVELVARAGFRKGYFGLEIIASDSRNALNKKDQASPETLLRLCSDNGVKAHLFCMFGYPGTGADDAWRTIDFLLQHAARIDTADIFPWTYAKHTRALGISPRISAHRDWALEFEHEGIEPGVMSSTEIRELATACEETVWLEAPRLLHPTYRLVSPWEGASATERSFATQVALV